MRANATSPDRDRLKQDTRFGRKKENLGFPLALVNRIFRGIDQPNLWHGKSLRRCATYGALCEQAPKAFGLILTKPLFDRKEGREATKDFDFQTSTTQLLFVPDILGELAPRGTCAIALEEGLLLRTNESAFVETERKLVDECELRAVVSLP